MQRDQQRRVDLQVARDVLASHADDIAATLCGVQHERERETGAGVERMPRFELRDLVLGPRVMTVALLPIFPAPMAGLAATMFTATA
jgi:hypothetical protein